MLDRFLAWHAAGAAASWSAPRSSSTSPSGRARIRGQVDRLERDADGRLVVVDLKTGQDRRAKNIEEHGQLAAYQVAVAAGGFAEHGTGARRSGAAAGRHGRQGQGAAPGPAARPTCRSPRPGPGELLAEVGDGMGAATFEVRTGTHCQRCPPAAAARCRSPAGR